MAIVFTDYTLLRSFLDGMLGMMALYALLHYVQQRRAIYWQYALYIGCMVLDFKLADQGHHRLHYLPGTYFPETFVETMAYLLYIQFAMVLMDIRHTDYISYRLLRKAMMAFGVALFLDSMLMVANTSLELRSNLYMVSRVLICGVGIILVPRLFRRRDAVVGYFIVGSVSLLACSVVALSLNYRPLQVTSLSMQAFVHPVSVLEIGVVIEVVCFVLGLSVRHQRTEHEKIVIQAQLLSELRENERKQEKLQRIRNDIARELHDDLGADLSGLSMLSKVAASQLVTQPDEAQATLQQIGETARRVVTGMREIIWSLNAAQLSVESTLFRLRETAYALFAHQATELHLTLPIDLCEADIPPENRRELFLMYKEILHNVVRHAYAQHVYATMQVHDQLLCLTVSDDGVGFDVYTCKHLGNGLASLQQRANTLGGQLNIDSEPGRGTTVYFCGPVLARAQAADVTANESLSCSV